MHPHRRIAWSCLAVATLLWACTRTPTPEASQAAAAEAPGDAQAYYAHLVKLHGQDLSACGPAETPAAAACTDGDAGAAAAPARRVLLMLDSSGSMAARQGGQTKLAIAQDALLAFASRLEGDVQVGLRVYGHRGSNRDADKAASCLATELVHPFAARDDTAFASAVRSFQPRGFTPIAASLQAAAQDFTRGDATAQGNVVYLVSDGVETCDGDPAAAARALNASGIRVVVNVIGFDVDAAAERQLLAVAEAGGGEYVTARTRRDLDDAFARRLRALTARYNCKVVAEIGAFNTTAGTHTARYTCLVGKATSEYTAIVGAASADAVAGRATAAQRDYAMAQAEAKRRRIVEPAGATRQAAVDAVGTRRDRALEAAQRERDAALEAANASRGR